MHFSCFEEEGTAGAMPSVLNGAHISGRSTGYSLAMARTTIEATSDTVEAAGFRVTGVIRDTRVGFAGGRGGVAAAYARPVRLEVHGPDGSTIVPIRDIQLRIIVALVLVPLLFEIFRRRRS